MSVPAADRPPVFTRTDLRVVLLCFLGYSSAYLGRIVMPASVLPMQEALGWTKAELGGVQSCFFFALALQTLGLSLTAGFLCLFLRAP